MARGRKPQSTAAKEAKGSFDRHPERRPKNEPKAKVGKPRKPKSISGDKLASAKWRDVVKILDEMNLITTADADLIESYCLNESYLVLMSESIRSNGTWTADEKGNPKKNPDCIEWNKAMDRRVKLMAEMGLTPSARVRLEATGQETDDKFAEFVEMMGNARK